MEKSQNYKENNIEALSHWPKGLHEYSHTPQGNNLTNTETITTQTMSLPCSPFLTEQERDYVIDTMHKYYA